MRKIITALLSIGLICLVSTSVFAHSGRTDSSGGHRDNKNKSGLGGYHYHCGGYPPHLHDGGCPYSESYSEPEPQRTPDSVEVFSEKEELRVGETTSVRAEIYPSDSLDQEITWESENESIAVIDESGNILAKKPGNTRITARAAGGATSSFSITILKVPVKKITLTQKKLSVDMGDSIKIKYKIIPENATNQKLKWSSKQPHIAKISEDGSELSFISPGKATITAMSSDGPSALCTIEVLPVKVTDFKVSLPDTVRVGDTLQLNVNVFPPNASDKKFTVSCAQNTVAKIGSNNELIAIQDGECLLVIENQNYTKEIPIHILPPLPTSVQISAMPQSVNVGEELEIEAQVSPNNADESEVIWTVDRSDLAVIENGQLLAKGSGTICLMASTNNGKTDSLEIVIHDNSGPIVFVILLICAGSGIGFYVWKKKRL